jgi:hypothetical protein
MHRFDITFIILIVHLLVVIRIINDERFKH